MSNITHIQFHIGDFLGGVMQMDCAEVGAYTMMIIAHYQAGLKGLPADEDKLRRITKCNPKVWARIRASVLEKFTLIDGFYIQERVCDELRKIHEKAGPGRNMKTTKGDVGIPKSSDDEPTSDTQVENKLLNLNNTEKTNHKPITYNHLKKEKVKKETKDFEEFWKAYPRRVGKGKAEEKFWIAREEIPQAELMQAVLAHAKQSKGKETEYIPHPATWLHQKRYFDETATAIIQIEKQDWPEWKSKMAIYLGDHVVKGWFNTANFQNGVLKFSKKVEFDRVNQMYAIDLSKMGVKEILFDPSHP